MEGDKIHGVEAQFSQSKLFLTTVTLLLILELYTCPKKVLLGMDLDN